MTASRLLKSFLFVAILTGVIALVSSYQLGELPSPWLPRIALLSLALALVSGLIGAETRPRLMLRFLAALFALLGVIACAADISIQNAATNGSGKAFSLLDHLNSFAPSLVMSLEAGVQSMVGTWAWDPVLTSVLGLPAYLLFFLLAVAAGIAGRPRRTVQIFVN